MNCPECGSENTRVLRTTKNTDTIDRERQCKICSARFHSFECYDQPDPELAFGAADALRDLDKALGWLKQPARHLPVVRDSLKLIERAVKSLQDPAICSRDTAQAG